LAKYFNHEDAAGDAAMTLQAHRVALQNMYLAAPINEI